MGSYPIIRLKHISTEYIDGDIFTKALEYVLFIKHAGSMVGLKESDEEWVEGEDIAGRNPA